MKKKNIEQISDEFRNNFGLSSPEGVIQKYGCRYGVKSSNGKLFISQNYVCFSFKGKEPPIKIPFIKITDVTYGGGEIEIKTNNNVTHLFGGFKGKRGRYAYDLIFHFWKNPPYYVDVAAYRAAAAEIARSYTEAAKKRTEEQIVKNKLDVNLANEILDSLNETKDMQNGTMIQLAEHGDTLNRIEDKLVDIEENLKHADHIMKGIESLPYYLFGGSTKKEVNEKREIKKKDNGTKLPSGSLPLIEIDALFKTGGSLSPCTIIFNPENFQIINPKKDKLFTSETQYSYTDVHTIEIKTNEYFDISFNTKKKSSITLCSAYRQIIVNQLHTRAQLEGHIIMVHFMKESSQFEYKEEWIYKINADKRASGKIDVAFQKLSSLFTHEETKRDAEVIDKKYDEIAGVLSKIIVDGRETNEVIRQHVEKMKKLEDMNNISEKMKNLGERMDGKK